MQHQYVYDKLQFDLILREKSQRICESEIIIFFCRTMPHKEQSSCPCRVHAEAESGTETYEAGPGNGGDDPGVL